eukprot:2363600-Rhodomonas_salina.4
MGTGYPGTRVPGCGYPGTGYPGTLAFSLGAASGEKAPFDSPAPSRTQTALQNARKLAPTRDLARDLRYKVLLPNLLGKKGFIPFTRDTSRGQSRRGGGTERRDDSHQGWGSVFTTMGVGAYLLREGA